MTVQHDGSQRLPKGKGKSLGKWMYDYARGINSKRVGWKLDSPNYDNWKYSSNVTIVSNRGMQT